MGATPWPTRAAAAATLAVGDTPPAAAGAVILQVLPTAGVEATAPARPLRAVAIPLLMSATVEAVAATTLVAAEGIPPGVAEDTAEAMATNRG